MNDVIEIFNSKEIINIRIAPDNQNLSSQGDVVEALIYHTL